MRQLLKAYQLEDHFAETKEWYDGYHFGDADVYCPWDVINHVDRLCGEPGAKPQTYWINTSGNETVRLELTYEEIGRSIDNLWSVLFTAGYLTCEGVAENGAYRLIIPNREVREVFVLQVREWFKENFIQDEKPMQAFCRAFLDGDTEEISRRLTIIMGKMISILDSKVPDAQKENFYHGLLLGLLRSEANWLILSNAESGEGFSDILIEPEDPDEGIVIEVKYASSMAGLKEACEKAMAQIKERRYEERLRNDGRESILAYGIAFFKKRCRVVCERL